MVLAAFALSVAPGCHAAPQRSQIFSDVHNSVLLRLLTEDRVDALTDSGRPVDLAGLRQVAGGVTVLSIGIARFDMTQRRPPTLDDVLRFLARFQRYAAAHWSVSGQWVYALEGAHLLEGALERVPELRTFKVRYVGLAHHFHDSFVVPGDGSASAGAPSRLRSDSRLSDAGVALVAALDAAGILVDVAHLPDAAFTQLLSVRSGRIPLISSHGGARTLCDSPRNLSDTQMQAVAQTGGVVAVSVHGPHLRCDGQRATVDDVVAHLRHVADLVGPEHTAVGTDLEGRIRPVAGLERLAAMPELGAALLRAGFSREEVDGILWANARRLLREELAPEGAAR